MSFTYKSEGRLEEEGPKLTEKVLKIAERIIVS